jgi:hypothetical protein
MKKPVISLLILAFALAHSNLHAQADNAELAKQLANPIASLISVPLQNNSDFGIGEWEGTRNTLNIQPVAPFDLSEDWNLITRAILPVISQYSITGPGDKQFGLGDMVVSGFISPKESTNGITWGAGPVLLLPIGGDSFSFDQFGLGPTAVALKQAGPWTLGGLVNQIWGFDGLSQFFLQPFAVYNWPSGAGVGGNMEWTQNWSSGTGTLWLNPTFSAVTSVADQKIQVALGPRFNLAAPAGAGANWGVRAVVVALFPK